MSAENATQCFKIDIPQIIEAASKSPRSIFAPMAVALAVLAYFYFRSAPYRMRVGAFVTLFPGGRPASSGAGHLELLHP